MKRFLLTAACALGLALGANAAEVTDVLTVDDLKGATPTTQGYEEFTVTGESGAEYYLQCAHNKLTRLQFRTDKSNSGLVVTKSAGKVVSVTLTWEKGSNNTPSRKMNFYSSDKAYAKATELYATPAPTAVGSLSVNTGTNFVYTDKPEYIAMRSNAGAIYLTKIEIVWETGDTPQPTLAAPEISCLANNVTITHPEDTDVYYTLDNTEPTKNSTPYTDPFPISENVTVKAIATKGDEVSAVTTFHAIYVGSYANYGELAAGGEGSFGSVEGPITGIYKNGDHLYTIDNNEGYMLLIDNNKFADITEFANGYGFSNISGKYTVKNGVPQITDVTLGLHQDYSAIAPKTGPIESITNEMINCYVKFSNVSIVEGERANNYEMSDESGSITLYNQFNNADRYDQVTVEEGKGFTVTGFVSSYGGNLQIIPVLIEDGQVMETVESPVFSVNAGAVAEGTQVEITTATEGASIYYTLDESDPDENSTLFEGSITIDKAMTIKAIAIKNGMLNSDIATASYTIIDPTIQAVTFLFNDPATLTPTVNVPNSSSTETSLSNKTFTNGVVSIAYSGKEGASNNPRLWYNQTKGIDLRIYQHQYFTVSVSEGYILGDIKFTHYDTGKLSSLSCGEIGTYAVNSSNSRESTWTKPNDQTDRTVDEVRFTATKTVQMTTMTVNFKPGTPTGVDNIAVDDENAPTEYYNLQGVRVDNPTPGLYIVRRGNTTSKTLVR